MCRTAAIQAFATLGHACGQILQTWLALLCGPQPLPPQLGGFLLRSDVVQPITVDNFDVPAISEIDYAPGRKGPECTAHRFERDADIVPDIRTIHWQIDFCCVFAPGSLKVFKHLKEKSDPCQGVMTAQDKGMTLRLAQFVAELAYDVKFQVSVFAESGFQGGRHHPVCTHRSCRLGGVYIASVFGQSEQIIGELETDDMSSRIR